MERYCKRLIEVDLPIKQISSYAQNEKNLRSGHPWHLHIWWARRPWGACRAIALASLLPAPTDDKCDIHFIEAATRLLTEIGFRPQDDSRPRLQEALLKFVGEFSRWEAGADPIFKLTAQKLMKAAYPDHTPMVFDPFSGYGAIPGEAARLGCVSIAMDLNPVAVLVMKTLLEAVPKHGLMLIEKFVEGAEYIQKEAYRRLETYYPKRNGKDPIAWLWARTVTCEGPACGAEIPLISQTVLAKGKRKAWVKIIGDKNLKRVSIQIEQGNSVPSNLVITAGGGNAVCPVCGFTTKKDRVKIQGTQGKIGHRLFGCVLAIGERKGKEYISSDANDQDAVDRAKKAWDKIIAGQPDRDLTEKYPAFDPRAFTAGLYGITFWGDLFSPRQKLTLTTLVDILQAYHVKLIEGGVDKSLANDVIAALSLAISNGIHYSTNMSTWLAEHMISAFITGNAVAMRWDWAEANMLSQDYVGGLDYSFNQSQPALQAMIAIGSTNVTVTASNATKIPLPDDASDLFFTDPPYYDVVPYADLSDLCYVWLKRMVGHLHPDLFSTDLTPKTNQIVVNPYAIKDGRGDQSPQRYQERMTQAFTESRRVLKPNGLGAIVFAHKGTAAWEAFIGSIINAGFMITASWPIDTERAARMRANKSAALGSSVHLIVRPRENADGSLQTGQIGEWRDVLNELPNRIHNWMPRLAEEGVVGADAIFACLGPALEIFSRYTQVEKASGEKVELREYLEQVWAAVAKEALNMIFSGADAAGFEEDARLTAMWLWTLATGSEESDDIARRDEEEEENKGKTKGGFSLEYDAARKIAQGLGAHLEDLKYLVSIQGDIAILLPVAMRTRYLFGKDAHEAPRQRQAKKENQLVFNFEDELKQLDREDKNWSVEVPTEAGKTVLDQLHQSMILFAAGRSEALKRQLVEDGIGRNPLYWRLAQALSALYPKSSEEKRWVDGVLARKKGLGL